MCIPILGEIDPIWRAYFSDGLVQPPTNLNSLPFHSSFEVLLISTTRCHQLTKKKHTKGWLEVSDNLDVFGWKPKKIPKMRCLFEETSLLQDIPRVISSKKFILKFIPLRAQILYVIVYWKAQLPLGTYYQAFIKGQGTGMSHVSLECALPPQLTTATAGLKMIFSFLARFSFSSLIRDDFHHHSPKKPRTFHPQNPGKGLHPRSLTARPWNMMVRRLSFQHLFGWSFFRGILIVYTPPVAQGLG